jgi:hypothetical protein
MLLRAPCRRVMVDEADSCRNDEHANDAIPDTILAQLMRMPPIPTRNLVNN